MGSRRGGDYSRDYSRKYVRYLAWNCEKNQTKYKCAVSVTFDNIRKKCQQNPLTTTIIVWSSRKVLISKLLNLNLTLIGWRLSRARVWSRGKKISENYRAADIALQFSRFVRCRFSRERKFNWIDSLVTGFSYRIRQKSYIKSIQNLFFPLNSASKIFLIIILPDVMVNLLLLTANHKISQRLYQDLYSNRFE